jgi:hypothetical protein
MDAQMNESGAFHGATIRRQRGGEKCQIDGTACPPERPKFDHQISFRAITARESLAKPAPDRLC